jgi:hypothetical protein
MKLNNPANIILRVVACMIAFSSLIQAQTTTSQLPNAVTPKFVDIGPTTLQSFPVQNGMQVVGEYIIETLGYSEIRFFAHVFVDNYSTTPIHNAKLRMRFFSTINGGSWNFADHVVNSTVTSYIEGYTIQKIYGKTTRILVWPENMPPGPYRAEITYYLIP